jgi:hypothetical protein
MEIKNFHFYGLFLMCFLTKSTMGNAKKVVLEQLRPSFKELAPAKANDFRLTLVWRTRNSKTQKKFFTVSNSGGFYRKSLLKYSYYYYDFFFSSCSALSAHNIIIT